MRRRILTKHAPPKLGSGCSTTAVRRLIVLKSSWGKSGTRSGRNLSEPLERFTPCAELWCDAPPWPSWAAAGPVPQFHAKVAQPDVRDEGIKQLLVRPGKPSNRVNCGEDQRFFFVRKVHVCDRNGGLSRADCHLDAKVTVDHLPATLVHYHILDDAHFA